jgi:hypothetical protein
VKVNSRQKIAGPSAAELRIISIRLKKSQIIENCYKNLDTIILSIKGAKSLALERVST